MTITQAQRERAMYVTTHMKVMYELHPMVQHPADQERAWRHGGRSRGQPGIFHDCDFLLVARDQFLKSKSYAYSGEYPDA